jgi:hypothetical protein
MPVRPAIRRIPPEPPRRLVLVFSEDIDDTSLPPPGVPAPPISHVARRRVSAEAVELEDLELLDEVAEDSRPLAASMTAPAMWPPSSLAPLAMDTAPPMPVPLRAPPMPVPLRAPTTSGAWKRRATRTGGAVAMLTLGIAIAGVLGTDGLGAETSAAVRSVATAPLVAPVHEAPAAVPVVTVSMLPRAPEGTIVGAEGHRLWIDGRLATGFIEVVACGRHLVKVGSAGTPREVNVPCGDEVAVTP